MRRQIHNLFFSILLILPAFSFAQQTKPGAQANRTFVNSMVQEDIRSSVYNTNLTEVDGSPYFSDEWQEGYFIKTNQENTGKFEIRYNIYEHIVEFMFQGEELFLNPNTVKGFALQNDGRLRFFKNGFHSPDDKISKDTFFEVLLEGKVSLLKYHNARLIKAISPDISTGKYIDEFVQKEEYYLATDLGAVNKIKLKKRDVLKKLPDKKEQLEEYAKKYNLSFDDEASLIQILKYYTVLSDEN